jgi:hypothetical protein
MQTLQTAGAKGAGSKTNFSIVNRVYCRQLGLLGGAIHAAAIVCLVAEERTMASQHHVRSPPQDGPHKFF